MPATAPIWKTIHRLHAIAWHYKAGRALFRTGEAQRGLSRNQNKAGARVQRVKDTAAAQIAASKWPGAFPQACRPDDWERLYTDSYSD